MNRVPDEAADETLPPARRASAVAAIVALHGALAWALLQAAPVREADAEAPPRLVELIAVAAPPSLPEAALPSAQPTRPDTRAPERPPAPAQRLAAEPSPRQATEPDTAAEPSPQAPPAAPPVPEPTAPVPAASPVRFTAPVPEPAPAPESAPMPLPAPAPMTAPAPAHDIPATAIEYLDPPAPAYPRASRRAGEAGLVVVRVFVGIDGVPRDVVAQQSSGFARLDEAALDAVRRARFRPYREDGRPVAGWARIPIPFELEK